jgi:hypothetical protein
MRDPEVFCTRFCRSPHGGRDELLPAHPYFAPFWRAWRERRDIIAEKTRQMTCSWMTCACLLWDVWTPLHREWPAMIMSRAQELVDDGGDHSTVDSLLGKMRYIYERLPEEFKFNIAFTFNRVVNKDTGSFIRGKSSTSQAGRGGTYLRAVQDEAAFIPNSEDTFSAIRPGVPRGLVMVSTPNGKGNNYYRMRSLNNSPWSIIRMHWRDHPGRACGQDCPHPESDDWQDHRGCWYYRACEELGFDKVRIARELNISYEESVGGRAFYAFGQHNIGSVEREPGAVVWRFWDFGSGGTTAIWFCHVKQLHTATGRLKYAVRAFDFYESHGNGARHYRDVCQKKWEDWGRPPVRDIGDPWSLVAKESDEGSWSKSLSDDSHPYRIYVDPSGCVGKSMETIIQSAQAFFGVIETQTGEHVPRFVVDHRQRKAIEHCESWAYQSNDDGVPISTKPRHDEHSHACTALCFGLYNLEPADTPDLDFKASDFGFVADAPAKEKVKW